MLLPTADSIAAVQKMVDADPEIASDLILILAQGPARSARYYQLGEDQIEPLLKEDPSQLLNTDLHLRLEFDGALALVSQAEAARKCHGGIAQGGRSEWIERLAIATGVKRDSPEFR